MKTLIAYILFSIALLTSNVTSAQEETLYSALGYPYKQLISRTDEIKIIFTENKENINCKVEINWKGDKITTSPVDAEKGSFAKQPLASCLQRSQAKSLLAKTFE